jgi:hypothetical protein
MLQSCCRDSSSLFSTTGKPQAGTVPRTTVTLVDHKVTSWNTQEHTKFFCEFPWCLCLGTSPGYVSHVCLGLAVDVQLGEHIHIQVTLLSQETPPGGAISGYAKCPHWHRNETIQVGGHFTPKWHCKPETESKNTRLNYCLQWCFHLAQYRVQWRDLVNME